MTPEQLSPINNLRAAIKQYSDTGHFPPQTVALDQEAASSMVRLKSDPQRFTPQIFSDDWAFTNQHPKLANIRLLRVVEGMDGVLRVVGRQGKALYAFPFIDNVE